MFIAYDIEYTQRRSEERETSKLISPVNPRSSERRCCLGAVQKLSAAPQELFLTRFEDPGVLSFALHPWLPTFWHLWCKDKRQMELSPRPSGGLSFVSFIRK
jgi:hypothetical protein